MNAREYLVILSSRVKKWKMSRFELELLPYYLLFLRSVFGKVNFVHI